jgi:hypothetical protein
MQVTWTFTGDGLLAFLGGALALFGVWWSNRQSVRNLQEQLDADKRSRREDFERQKKAVATAILFQIDPLYRIVAEEIATDEEHLPSLLLPGSFPVYEGNADNLGNLEPDMVASVVTFYSKAMRHFFAARELIREMGETERDARSASLGDLRLAKAAAAKLKYSTEVRAAIPEVENSAREACQKLSKFTGTVASQILPLAPSAPSTHMVAHAQTH